MHDLIIVYITSPSSDKARELVHHLLMQKLIACANIVPMISMYWWQGSITQEEESIIIAKTEKRMWDILQQEVIALHPYKVPCILAVPVQANKSYGDFVTHEIIK
jgi:periplasmic divalent cation tolerance protein